MEKVEEVLKRDSPFIKKLEVLKEKRKVLDTVLNARRDDTRDVEQINSKVRELDRQITYVCAEKIRRISDDICDEDETSMASSSSSEGSNDEALSSQFNGEGQKQTVVGQGSIGPGGINNNNSKLTFNYKNVTIETKNYYERRRKRKE